MTPEFDRQGNEILGSPYFESTDDEEFIERLDEKDVLRTAIQGANSRRGIGAKAEAIWKRAEEAQEKYAEEEAAYIEDGAGYDRLVTNYMPGPVGSLSTVPDQSATMSVEDTDEYRNSYPRDASNRFLSKHTIAEASRNTDAARKLRESLPADELDKLAKLIMHLQFGGTVHHPSEHAGMSVNAQGDVADPAWADHATKHEEWTVREAKRDGQHERVDAFQADVLDPRPLAKVEVAFAAAHEEDCCEVDAKATRGRVDAAFDKYKSRWDKLLKCLETVGANRAETRRAAYLRQRGEAAVSRRADAYVKQVERVVSAQAAVEESTKAEPDEPDAYDDEVYDTAFDVWAREHDKWELEHARAKDDLKRATERLTEAFADLSEEVRSSYAVLGSLCEGVADRIDREVSEQGKRDTEPTEPAAQAVVQAAE